MTADTTNYVWRPPTEMPDLRQVGVIALDTETKDEGLAAERGSAWPWGGGYVCGASVAYREGENIRALYFPLRHPDSTNFNSTQVFQWLRDMIASDVRIVGQNTLYDFGWLRAEAGIKMPPSERLEEIGALATLVDENRYSYALDELCKLRGLPGKNEMLLREGIETLGLVTNKRKKVTPQNHLWQLPARYVGPYAEADAASTLPLFESLDPILDQEGTRDAYRLEVDLLPMVLEMRRRGIRVDVAAAERARDHLLRKRNQTFVELSEKLGATIGMAEIGRTKWLVETFDKLKIEYPRTAKGNPSFTAGATGWMHKHPHWLPPLVAKADKYNKAAVDFLESHILGHVVAGRIHAEIHPHRSDDGGTRSLRFSYSNPPLQQMAARDEEIAPLIRGAFLPEEGETWAKPDISQQEFKFITHYATLLKLPRAREAADRYRADAGTDFHDLVAEMTGLARKDAKAVNFAKAFGAGVRKFAAMIGKSENEAGAIYAQYDRQLPFVKALAEHCEKTAKERGYIRLYDGARRHWTDWVPPVDWTKGADPCDRDEALRRISDPGHPWFGKKPLRRADTHKAMNALIQGSAARHTKLWMRAVWREGFVPLLQMHDCLDLSVNSPEQAERVAQLGREAVKLEVPIEIDLKYGHNWGDATHAWHELNGARTHTETSAQEPTPPVPPKEETKIEIEPKGKFHGERFQSAEPRDDDDEADGYGAGERIRGRTVEEYVYRDEHGRPHSKVVRKEPKSFPQFHWDNGVWKPGKPKGEKIPYRLPELLAAPPQTEVWITEGEKDADNSAARGLVATTISEGASAERPAYLNRWFAGKHTVYLLEDNDLPGRKRAAKIAAALNETVPNVHIVAFPELPEGSDVSDFLAMGGTKDMLLARARNAPKWEPPKWRWHFHGEVNPLETRTWLVELLIPEVGVGLLAGQWGTWKTFVAIDLAAEIMTGGTFISFPVLRKGAVLFLALEGESEIAVRIDAALQAKGHTGKVPFAWISESPRLLDKDAGQDLVAMVRQAGERMKQDFGLDVALVIIDTVGRGAGYTKQGDENDSVPAKIIAKMLAHAAKETGCFFLGVDHFGKDPNTGTRGSSAKEGDVDIVLALLGDKAQSGEVANSRLCARKRRSGPNGETFPFRTRIHGPRPARHACHDPGGGLDCGAGRGGAPRGEGPVGQEIDAPPAANADGDARRPRPGSTAKPAGRTDRAGGERRDGAPGILRHLRGGRDRGAEGCRAAEGVQARTQRSPGRRARRGAGDRRRSADVAEHTRSGRRRCLAGPAAPGRGMQLRGGRARPGPDAGPDTDRGLTTPCPVCPATPLRRAGRFVCLPDIVRLVRPVRQGKFA